MTFIRRLFYAAAIFGYATIALFALIVLIDLLELLIG